jgi:hypothetical protein
MMILGLAPTALVLRFYDVLSNRTVIRWDMFGNTTIIGTRPASVLMIANAAALVATTAVFVGIWQHRSLAALGLRRAYLAINLAQIVAIGLTCAMIVSEALGLKISFKPMIPAAMAVVLVSGSVLCWRLASGGIVRVLAVVLGILGLALLVFGAIAANSVVGYYAAAFALLAMAAVVLPQRAG